MTLSVYDLDGRRVATVHDGMLEKGTQFVRLATGEENSVPLPTGIYTVRLEVDGELVGEKKAAVAD